jgi:KDO2-lipid IV(A) lauroyltransferase
VAAIDAGGRVPARVAVPEKRRSMLPYYAYRFGETLVRVLPRRTAYWLGDRAADAMLLAVPHNFDALRDNLRHVIPRADDATMRHTLRHNVRNLTHSWIDVMEMSSHNHLDLPSRLDISGLENYHRAAARGHGVVIASLHYGSWEVGIAGWNALGGKMALLAEVLQPPQLFERIVGGRGNQRVQVIPIDVAAMRSGNTQAARRIGAASMREVFRVLRAGHAVAVALDRDLIGNGEPLPFFGKPAPIPIGAVDIAIRTGAAIVPVILYRAEPRVDAVAYPEIEYSADAPRETEVRKTAGKLLALFEQVISEHPDQWHVLDPIWPETAPA